MSRIRIQGTESRDRPVLHQTNTEEERKKKTGLPWLAWARVSIVAGFATARAIAATCERLKLVSLPGMTISAPQTIPARNYTAANGQIFLPSGGNRNADEPVQHQFRRVDARWPEAGTKYSAAKVWEDLLVRSPSR